MPHRHSRPFLVLLLTGMAWSAHAEYEPTESYDVREMHGFTVRVSAGLLEREELVEQTLLVLDEQVFDMVRRLPDHAVEKLRDIPIWVEYEMGGAAAMCYHVSEGWLSANGYNPEKARSVEVSNARAFLNHTIQQPSMVLHEYAHAWHHNFLPDGYGNAKIEAVYEAAKESGDYEAVRHINGGTQRHYALTNPMEYFAELSEAYFGINDFEPFVRGPLKHFDPKGYELIEEKWGVAEQPDFEPTGNYDVRELHGFTVRVSPVLLEREELAQEALLVLEHKLFDMTRRLPAHAVEKLRDIEVWAEYRGSVLPGAAADAAMCYHPSREWLEGNGYNPEKAGAIEILNARSFVEHTIEIPSMVLHEFAHAWHHNFLPDGYDNAKIKAAYEAAKESGDYEEVLHIRGVTQRHNALSDPMEYFAELTETYFGANLFEPFVRGELKHFDPEGYALIEQKWGIAD